MNSNIEEISELTPDQRALLMLRLRKKSSAQGRPASGAKTVRPVPREGSLPLSFAQQRLWFLHQLDPRNPSYNLPFAFRLTGQLDVPVLERALNEIIRRHEVLRTSFPDTEGKPAQVITPEQPTELPVVDLGEMVGHGADSRIEQLIAEEAQRPFDLARGPLMRSVLLRVGEEEHIVLFTMHHIISDGWSMTVLVREVKSLYKSFSEGGDTTLPELPIQYADYAHWQRQWLEGEELQTQLDYWKKKLEGIPARLELSVDKQRPRVQASQGGRQNFHLPAELVRELKTLGHGESVTLFMVLLAAFQTLLHLYTGEDDIPVGTPIAGRNQVEVEHLIGFFINTLVLRTDLSGDPTFRELLQRVREVTLSAYAHQDVPFERIVEEVRPQRSMGFTPLFQVLFALHNLPTSKLEISGVTLTPLNTNTNTTKFDLSLYMEEADGEIFGTLQYRADLFEPSTMTRMAEQLRTLLESICADPRRSLSSLPISSQDRRHEMLSDFNDDF